MSLRDYQRIDEVYHNMYKNKFHREEPLVKESGWDDEERQGDANGRWSDKRTGRSHRDDQGDEDEEYKAKAKSHMPEAAKGIMHKLKLEYGDKYNPEKAKAAVKHALASTTEEDCEEWMLKQDYSHTPDQKKNVVKYLQSDEENAEEKHCKWAAQGCDCGECEECQDNAIKS